MRGVRGLTFFLAPAHSHLASQLGHLCRHQAELVKQRLRQDFPLKNIDLFRVAKLREVFVS
jgi:hypothetical protein